MTDEERAVFKREITLEVMKELQLVEKPCENVCSPIRRSHWYEVHEHLDKQVATLTERRRQRYWRIFESIRNLVRATLNLDRVEHLKAEDVPAAMMLVDDLTNGIRKAFRGEKHD